MKSMFPFHSILIIGGVTLLFLPRSPLYSSFISFNGKFIYSTNKLTISMNVALIISILINIILLPLYLVVFFLFMLIWLLLTVSGIGPILQYYYHRFDEKLLNRSHVTTTYPDIRILTVPGTIHSATKGLSYHLAIRFSKPSGEYAQNPKGYVCMPNGLGATMVILGKVQDMLTEKGYAVLTFDRLGVGFSDDNPTGKSPTAEDLIRECDFAMNSVVDPTSNIKWIMVGPSMGSVVAQCYIAAYPEKIIGFLNMDGVAYPFHSKRKLFNFAAKIYKFYSMIIWTGILRPFIAMATKKSSKLFVSKTFPLNIARAQLNQSRFFYNISLEMSTMMDCCAYAARAWGPLNISTLDKSLYEILVRAPPTESVEVDDETDHRKIVTDRSQSERGSDWSSKEEMDELVSKLKSTVSSPTYFSLSGNSGQEVKEVVRATESPLQAIPLWTEKRLCEKWSELVVGVMSARNHDFGSALANSFYRPEMKDLAAAEHSIHILLAKKGYRSVYPKITHDSMFGKTSEIVMHVEAIHDALSSK